MRHDTSNTDPPRAFGRPLTHPYFPAKQEFPLEGTPMARGGQCRNVTVSGLVFKALVELRVAVCSAPVGQGRNALGSYQSNDMCNLLEQAIHDQSFEQHGNTSWTTNGFLNQHSFSYLRIWHPASMCQRRWCFGTG